jgi:hypothetical protein
MTDREAMAKSQRQEKREQEPSLELRRVRALEEISDTLESLRAELKGIATMLPTLLKK